jgi:hypothetical protein
MIAQVTSVLNEPEQNCGALLNVGYGTGDEEDLDPERLSMTAEACSKVLLMIGLNLDVNFSIKSLLSHSPGIRKPGTLSTG